MLATDGVVNEVGLQTSVLRMYYSCLIFMYLVLHVVIIVHVDILVGSSGHLQALVLSLLSTFLSFIAIFWENVLC